jgi:hypothetical protein
MPCILWNPKVHYCIHNSPPPVPILNQSSPICAPIPSLENLPHYYPPIYAWIFQVALSLRLPHQKPVCISRLPHTFYMLRLSHFPQFDHPNIWWGVLIIKFRVMYFSSLLCYLVPLRPKYSPQHLILTHHQLTFLLRCQRPSSTPMQIYRQNYISVYLSFCIFR